MSIIQDQILLIAKDKFNHQCFPALTGLSGSRAFRVPDDHLPFGFEYHGISIEVHVTGFRNLPTYGTMKFRSIPVLLILGMRRDGKTRVIAEGVLAHG